MVSTSVVRHPTDDPKMTIHAEAEGHFHPREHTHSLDPARVFNFSNTLFTESALFHRIHQVPGSRICGLAHIQTFGSFPRLKRSEDLHRQVGWLL